MNRFAAPAILALSLTMGSAAILTIHLQPARADTTGSHCLSVQPHSRTIGSRNVCIVEGASTHNASQIRIADCICEDFRPVCIAWVRGICNQWIDECVRSYCN